MSKLVTIWIDPLSLYEQGKPILQEDDPWTVTNKERSDLLCNPRRGVTRVT